MRKHESSKMKALNVLNLTSFPENRVRLMEILNDPIASKQLHVTGRDERLKQGFKNPCVVAQCKESHAPRACSNFKHLSAKDKQSAIAASKLCQNCLRFNRGSDQCSSQSRCKTCQIRHHTVYMRLSMLYPAHMLVI